MKQSMTDLLSGTHTSMTKNKSGNKGLFRNFKHMRVLQYILLFVVVVLFSPKNFAQKIFETPQSERIANYDISVKFIPQKKFINASMQLKWKNTSSDTVRNLRFHMYMNAFKNSQTTMMKESYRVIDENFGWCEIKSIVQSNGDNLIENMKYIQPDDNNENDETVLEVKLKTPVLPNNSITLDINFETQLPKLFKRTGYAGNYFFVGQWFPKLGVYEKAGQGYTKKGQWKCHQYHKVSEFYADYGVYKVDITLPKEYVVGASGVLQEEKKYNDGTKTLKFTAEDVVDFSWTASPDFKIISDKWEHINLKLLITKEHKKQAGRFLTSVKKAIEYFDVNVGKYPYPNLTIVVPPIKGSNSSGMEYPCLITTSTIQGLPENVKFPEMLTIHEFGHQYFMQLIATNEAEEAWLDEGITHYYETRILQDKYGTENSLVALPGINYSALDNLYAQFVNNANIKSPVFQKSWEYPAGHYQYNAYTKPAIWLMTLERLVGRGTMDEIMTTYFDRWKFKHPCTQDFIEIANEIITKEHGDKYGENINWFFNQMLYSSYTCDYEVKGISIRKTPEKVGIFTKDGEPYVIKKSKETSEYEQLFEEEELGRDEMYESKVKICRKGEIIMPVEITVHFENGKEVKEYWNGKSSTYNLIYNRKAKVEWAQIDPKTKLLIDMNINNNSYTLKPRKAPYIKWTVKFLFWVQNVIQFFAILV